MKIIYFFLIINILSLGQLSICQTDNLIGSSALNSHPNTYDYSSPISPKMEVKLWGAISNPGTYSLPIKTNLTELLSFAGGLNESAELDEIKIIRKVENKDGEIFETTIIDFEKYLEDDEIIDPSEFHFVLKDGDVIFIPGSTSWIQSITPITTIVSVVSSIATIVYLINRNN